MNHEYEALFREGCTVSMIVKRTPSLAAIISEARLNRAISVECRPLDGCMPNRCFVNVDRQMAMRGGRMMTGWYFQEFSNRFVNGIAHALWMPISARALDITPHEGNPPRIMFCEDVSVALKRGYTVPPKKILSTDPRVIAVERFETAIDKIFADRFVEFGQPIDVSKTDVIGAADQAGLPHDVAFSIMDIRLKANSHYENLYPRG